MARKILLADDSVTAQNMGRKILADAGYDVLTVNNGSAALKRVAESQPDLIILDVYMPGYSGLEVCQRLKDAAETAHIPILLSVGKLEPFKPQEARRVRADAHIVKPFEASELLAALGHLETLLVPESQRAGFCAPTAAVAEAGEESGKAEEANADGESGRKNGVRSAGKKKTEQQEPAADEGASGFRDFRKAGSKAVAELAVEVPAGVSHEELSALSAVAAKLDETSPEPTHDAQEGGGPAEPAVTGVHAQLEQTPTPEAVADLPHGITQEELDALSAVAAQLDQSGAEAEPSASIAESTGALAGDGRSLEQGAGSVEHPQMLVVAPMLGMTEGMVETSATGWNETENAGKQDEPGYEGATVAEAGRVEAQAHVVVNAGQFPDEIAPVDRNDEPMFASGVGAATPSDEELAAALRLLTPATAHATEQAGGSNFGTDDAVVSRWAAEAVGLTPQEAAMSLEAEMFRTFAGKPSGEIECAPVADATSTNTPGDSDGMANMAKQVLASQEIPKAMAAAAAAENSPISEDADIASIVDRVLADLRPKIVEEIARKLGKR